MPTAKMNQKRNIFLSHNHKDKPFVRQLVKNFEKAGLSCWVDEAELDIGDSIIDRIGQGIYESDMVAAIISTNSVGSAWVQKELQLAMTREISGRKIRVLPVVIDSCTEQIPYYLRDKLYADFRDSRRFQENLFMLIRAVQRRLELPKTGKTLAPIFDVGDVGAVVHDQGEGFYGFRKIRIMTQSAIFYTSIGLLLILMAVLMQRSHWVHTAKILAVAGGAIMMSGMLIRTSSHYFQVAFNRDRRLLYGWEKIGDTGFFFTRKWRERYRIGASVVTHSIGMVLDAFANFLLISGIVLLLVVLLFDVGLLRNNSLMKSDLTQTTFSKN